MKKKLILVTASVALTACAVFGGTLAWLTSTTDPVTNLFTPSKVNVRLEETGATATGALSNAQEKQYKLIPGVAMDKDPKATVLANSEDCYLFVQLTKGGAYDTYLQPYEMYKNPATTEAEWTQLKDENNTPVDGIYYRKVGSAATDQTFQVLQNNQVMTREFTRTQMTGITADNQPTLKVQAFAVQLKNGETEFTPLEAWNNKG